MNVDSRYPVRHTFPPGGSGERAASSLSRVTGYRRFPQRGTDNAQLFAQPRTLRIRHADSLNFSSANSISPLRACPILHLLEPIFMRFSGPQAQTDTRDNPDIAMV